MLSEAWCGLAKPSPTSPSPATLLPDTDAPEIHCPEFFFKPLYSGWLVVTNWIMYTGLPTHPWEEL